MKRLLVLLLVVVLVAGFFTGCTKAPVTEAKVDKTEEVADAKEEVVEDESFTVVYIPYNTGNPYYDPIIQGFKDSVEAAGGVFETTASDTPDPTGQIPVIRAQIQKGVDVIALDPTSIDALNDVMDEARAAGVRMFCVGDDVLGNEEHREAAIVATEYRQIGYDSIEIFAEFMGYEGQFAVLSATTDSPFQNEQIEIYEEVLAEEKYSNMEIVEVFYGDDEPEKSFTEAEAAIQKYPDLKGLMCPTTVAYVAAAQAVENAGLQGQIEVYGTAFPNQCREFIKNGVVSGAILWDTYRLGVVAGEFIDQVLHDGLVIEEGTKFQTSYGEAELLENNVIYAGPPQAFNEENVDDFDF
jgi:rhamnose transport system substrate-binding protein